VAAMVLSGCASSSPGGGCALQGSCQPLRRASKRT
jgi:hypothetical protein